MSRIIFVIFLNSLVCLSPLCAQNNSQRSELKPAVDACPSWDNKQTVSKADYFLSLRKTSGTSKTNEYAQNDQTNKNFDKPRYSSLVYRTSQSHTEPQQVQNNLNDVSMLSEKTREEFTSIPTINFLPAPEIAHPVIQPDLLTIQAKSTEEKPIVKPDEEAESTEIETGQHKKRSNFFTINKKENKRWLKKINVRKKNPANCPAF